MSDIEIRFMRRFSADDGSGIEIEARAVVSTNDGPDAIEAMFWQAGAAVGMRYVKEPGFVAVGRSGGNVGGGVACEIPEAGVYPPPGTVLYRKVD